MKQVASHRVDLGRARGVAASAAMALILGALVPVLFRGVGPTLAVGALAAVVAGVFLVLDWRTGPYLLGAALPFEGLLASEGIASGMKLLTVAAVGSVLVHAIWKPELFQRIREVITDGPIFLLGCLLAWSLLSVTWARSPDVALTRSITLLGVGVLMILVAMLGKREIRLLWTVIFAASVASVLVALIAPPAPTSTSPWATTARFTSGGHHPVDYGGILVVVGVITFLGLRWSRLDALRYPGLLVLSIGLLSTGTRAAVVTLALVPALMLLTRAGAKGSRFAVAGLVVVVVLSAAVVVRFLPSTASLVGERYASLQNVSSAETWTGRLDLWAGAVKVFTEHPLTGVGAGNYPLVAPQYSGFAAMMAYSQLVQGVPVAHNAVLSIASELGLVGLLFFLMFWVSVGRRAWRTRFESRFAGALAVGLGCYFVIAMSTSWEYVKLPYVLFGSLASLALGQPVAEE